MSEVVVDSIACNLIENALDYLLLAGEQVSEGDPRHLKHAIANLADGVELILKARLELVDWKLLFDDPENATPERFESGSFQSVRYRLLLDRLQESGVSVESSQARAFAAVRRARNQIRHFAITLDRTTAVSLVTQAYAAVLDFIAQHFEEVPEGTPANMLAKLRRLLGELDDFVQSRLAQVQPQIDKQNYSFHVECHHCLQDTLYPEDGEVSCAFCGYRGSADDAVAAWVDAQYKGLSPKECMIAGGDFVDCPECGATAIPVEGGGCDARVQCLYCGESSVLKDCIRCGNSTYGTMCDWCEHFSQKDD